MVKRMIGITFHGIGKPERTLAPDEAPYWISTERFEAILDAIAHSPRPYKIYISFDDSNFSDHMIALPRLLARGLRADFFVLAGRVGRPGALGEAEIRALQAAGMAIGSHGAAHRDWRRLDAAALDAELKGSRDTLEEICGGPVTTAAIPFGSYNARVLRALRRAGYTCAYSSDGGPMRLDAFLRPRRSVREDMTEAEIENILSGHGGPVQGLRRMAATFRMRRF